jgi:hypothetical protein
MAKVKISQLPAASTPLDGTELVPIVQSGVTEQVTVANLTAGRTVAAGTVTVSNNALIGTTTQRTIAGQAPELLLERAAAARSAVVRNTNDANGPLFFTAKSRGTANGSYTVVASGDALGTWNFAGSDGTADVIAAAIRADVDGTPGANDMPGRLVFSTTADGASSPTERMRITQAGLVGIGAVPQFNLDVVGAGSQAIRARSTDTTGSTIGRVMAEFAGGSSVMEMRAGLAYTILLSANATDPLIFGVGGGTERMRITAAGNVGVGTSAPLNRLDVSGSFGRGAPVTKTGNFTLAAAENWLVCNGAGTITVTFPAASSWTGREVMIKTIAAQTVVSASSNVVPLAGGAAGTAILAASAGAWATLVSDGTNWVIMQA